MRVGDSWRCLSRLSWFAGRNDAAEEQGRRAVDVLAGTGTPELGFAYSNRAQLRMLSSDLAGTREWAARTLEVADGLEEGPGRTELRVHALNNLGTIEVVAGDLAEGVAMLGESLAVARRHELHEHAARAYCNLAASGVTQRRFADARRWLDEGIDYCAERDLDSWTHYLRGWLSTFHLLRGEHDAAREVAESLLRNRSVASVGAVEPLVALAHVRARRGEPEVDPLLERAGDLAAGMKELQRIAPVVALRCELAWLRGDDAAAAGLAAETWPRAEETDCPWNRGVVARWMQPAPADAGPVAEPFAAELAGEWARAADLWTALGCPFDAGLALARSSDPELLARAVAVFEGIGARAAAARVRADLRAAGHPAPRTPRASTVAHDLGLTAREADVLPLLVAGLTDAAIAEHLVISRRTAEHHVASILAKTGARSRRDLGDALGTDGPAAKLGTHHP